MIDSLKGFLVRCGKSGLRRMTASQKRGVHTAVDAAFDNLIDNGGAELDVIQLARRVAHEAIEAYPADRSCFSCDFLAGETFCNKWNKAAPDVDALEDGCDHHQTHGAPF